MIAAADMASDAGIDPRRFRQALRDARLGWHVHKDRWLVERDGLRHAELLSILARLEGDGA